MMKYEAPDGHIMISDPNSDVTYSCPAPQSWPRGTNYVYITGEGLNGVTLLKVKRNVYGYTAEITLTEGTQQELTDYINSII